MNGSKVIDNQSVFIKYWKIISKNICRFTFNFLLCTQRVKDVIGAFLAPKSMSNMYSKNFLNFLFSLKNIYFTSPPCLRT